MTTLAAKINPTEAKQAVEIVNACQVAIFSGADLEAHLQTLLAQLASLQHENQSSPVLQFGLAVACLHLHSLVGSLSDRQVTMLTELTTLTVKLYFNGDRRSLGGHLYSLLCEAESSLAAGRGDHALALGKQQLAVQIRVGSRDANEDGRQVVLGIRQQRMGNSSDAISAFRSCEINDSARAEVRIYAALMRMETLKLAGSLEQASDLLGELGRLVANDQTSIFDQHIRWSELCFGIQRDENAARLVGEVFSRNSQTSAERALLAFLIVHALRTRDWQKRVPKIRSIRARFQKDFKTAPGLRLLARLCQSLESFYDSALPLDKRCEDLCEALVLAPTVLHVEQQLLLEACCARAFGRLGQSVLQSLALQNYAQNSRKLSDGLSTDVLGYVSDLARDNALGANVALATTQEGQGARALAVLKTATTIATGLMTAKARMLVAKQEEQDRIAALAMDKMGDSLAKALAGLQGIGVKFGQMLSYCSEIVPEPLRVSLTVLQDGAAQRHPIDARAIIEQELGSSIDKLFASWSDEPFATASIGQVHHAKTLDGCEVAVKVQYPGVAKAMASDMKNLRLLQSFFSPLYPNARVNEIVDECSDILLAECDYMVEQRNLELFQKIFRGRSDIIIPQVYPLLSSRRVLTTDMMRLRSFREFSYEASQAERNKLGSLLFEFMYTGIFRHGMVYGDPQPGNIFVTESGGLCVVDFGCVKIWSSQTLGLYREYFRSALLGDKNKVIDSLQRLGMIVDEKKFDIAGEFESIGEYFMRPFLYGDVFKFDHSYIKRLAERSLSGNPNRKYGTVPKDLVVLARIVWGLGYMLAELEAETCWRDILVPLLFAENEPHDPLPYDYYCQVG